MSSCQRGVGSGRSVARCKCTARCAIAMRSTSIWYSENLLGATPSLPFSLANVFHRVAPRKTFVSYDRCSPYRVDDHRGNEKRPAATRVRGAFHIVYSNYIRISASTPAGRLRFCRLSIVFGVALVMSIRRLCTRISNVSPPVLYTCGDFTTV